MNNKSPNPAVDLTGRFLQALGHLTEWVKHIITIGSALMVLGAALLKDLVKGAPPPFSYVIAGLLVLSYASMLTALWKGLAFTREAGSLILSTSETLGNGDELSNLQALLTWAQRAFLCSLVLFALLACVALLTWALGLTSPPSSAIQVVVPAP